MHNIAASELALSLVGLDSEKNPYEQQMEITKKIFEINNDIDLNELCVDPDYLFKDMINKGIVTPDKMNSLMKKIYYVVNGRTDGGFADVIFELDQIKQEMESSKTLEATNTKTL